MLARATPFSLSATPAPHGLVDEVPLAVVAIQLRGNTVAADEQVRPAVAVVVEHGDAHDLVARIVHARARRRVLEPAAAQVVIELRCDRLVRVRPAIAAHAVLRAPDLRLDRRRPLDVVADEQIQETVLVVVEPCRADRERSCAGCRRGSSRRRTCSPPALRISRPPSVVVTNTSSRPSLSKSPTAAPSPYTSSASKPLPLVTLVNVPLRLL